MIKLLSTLSTNEYNNEIERLYKQFCTLWHNVTNNTTIITDTKISHPKFWTIIETDTKLELVNFIQTMYNIKHILPHLFNK